MDIKTKFNKGDRVRTPPYGDKDGYEGKIIGVVAEVGEADEEASIRYRVEFLDPFNRVHWQFLNEGSLRLSK